MMSKWADSTLLSDVVRAELARRGLTDVWTMNRQGFWFAVLPADCQLPPHGWKLHVSATVLSAPLVLARAASVLTEAGCAFKFARDLHAVGEQTSANADRGAAGKFITAYPPIGALEEIASELHLATLGLPGPRILSDRPLSSSSLVHYRYGSFIRETRLDDFGRFVPVMVGPDGKAVEDRRTAAYSAPAWASDPFARGEPVPSRPHATTVRLDDRFTVDVVLKHSNRGGVFLATDGRSGNRVVIKQGRAHVSGDIDGSDARDAVRHESEVLELLSATGLVPDRIAFFTQQGDVFLVQEFLPGRTLEQWVREEVADSCPGTGLAPDAALQLARKLVEVLSRVHDENLVLRDLKPGNIMMLPDGDLRLIDLEHAAEPDRPARHVSTHGFAAPSASDGRSGFHRPAPRLSDDVFSLGATLCHAVAALPTWEIPTSDEGRGFAASLQETALLASTGRPGLQVVLPLVLGLTEPKPQDRWSLHRARDFLNDPTAERGSPLPGPPSGVDATQILEDGLGLLLHTVDFERAEHLWQPGGAERDKDQCNGYDGAASILPLLVRTSIRTGDRPEIRRALQRTAHWVAGRVSDIPRTLPGLHSGRAGTTMALIEAAEHLANDDLADRAAALGAALPVLGPHTDLTHGLAGAGSAQIQLWRSTGDGRFLDRAVKCADEVLNAGVTTGTMRYWEVPDPASGTSRRAAGFAHGAAGIGAFLLETAIATDREEYLDAADATARGLIESVEIHEDQAYWPHHSGNRRLVNWCNGSAGIGTFLLRTWQATDRPHLLTLAEQAARAARQRLWQQNSYWCCGLPGIGNFFLDLEDATGESWYRDAAEETASILISRRTVRGGRTVVVPGDSSGHDLFGYGTGLAGVLGFLQRLRFGGGTAVTFGLRPDRTPIRPDAR
ncbi:class IV lanthionine synthetase LanL [Streptomyces sp. NPDC058701]|uniref:class IV lanthionine synthetase LanL n=1 Tax=Streptomyces sp. NPDC058701 TaxID=3346608 RepID=UPI003650EF2C